MEMARYDSMKINIEHVSFADLSVSSRDLLNVSIWRAYRIAISPSGIPNEKTHSIIFPLQAKKLLNSTSSFTRTRNKVAILRENKSFSKTHTTNIGDMVFKVY